MGRVGNIAALQPPWLGYSAAVWPRGGLGPPQHLPAASSRRRGPSMRRRDGSCSARRAGWLLGPLPAPSFVGCPSNAQRAGFHRPGAVLRAPHPPASVCWRLFHLHLSLGSTWLGDFQHQRRTREPRGGHLRTSTPPVLRRWRRRPPPTPTASRRTRPCRGGASWGVRRRRPARPCSSWG